MKAEDRYLASVQLRDHVVSMRIVVVGYDQDRRGHGANHLSLVGWEQDQIGPAPFDTANHRPRPVRERRRVRLEGEAHPARLSFASRRSDLAESPQETVGR